MMTDMANMAAQESSMETVPIMITTSRMRSSSAEPEGGRGQGVRRSGGQRFGGVREIKPTSWRDGRELPFVVQSKADESPRECVCVCERVCERECEIGRASCRERVSSPV